MSSIRLRWKRGAAPAMALAVVALLAACGSSSTSHSQSASGGSAPSAQIAAAKALVQKYSAVQPALGIKPLTKRPPRGLTVGYINCTIPTCSVNAAASGFAALGWKVVNAPFDLAAGPSSYIAAWDNVLQKGVQEIIFPHQYPNSIVAKQLAEAKQKGIHVVQEGGGTPSDSKYGIIGCYICGQDLTLVGKLQAAVALSSAGKAVTLGYITDPDITGCAQELDPAQSYLTSGGGGSTLKPIDISLTNTPQQDAATVVGFLERNPDVKYVAACFGEVITALPQALSQAGLASSVKLIGALPDPSDLQFIRQGQELAGIDHEGGSGWWRGVDALARASVGDKVDPFAVGWARILTKANVTSGNVVPDAPNYEQIYKAAWHVG